MKILKITGQFKRDLKRYKNQGDKLAELEKILKKLLNDEEIPAEYNPHPLIGNYKGHMECHIQGDFLLIWKDPKTEVIYLVRLGSHSELF